MLITTLVDLLYVSYESLQPKLKCRIAVSGGNICWKDRLSDGGMGELGEVDNVAG